MMKKNSKKHLGIIICAICASLFLISITLADTVRLKGGRAIHGVPTGSAGGGTETKDRREVQKARDAGDTLILQTVSGIVGIPRAEIAQIEPDSEAVNHLLLAEFQIRCGKALEAEHHATKALELGASHAAVRDFCLRQEFFLQKMLMGAQDTKGSAAWTSLVRTIGGFARPVETGGPGDFTPPAWEEIAGDGEENLRPEGRATKNERTETGSVNDKFYLRMARVFAAAGEGAFALELLDRLGAETLKKAARTESFVRPLMIEQMRRVLGGYDFQRASTLIQRMEAAGLGVGNPSRILLVLRWAAFERSRSHYDAALTVLDERLRPLSPSLAQERMESALAEARGSLAEQGRFSEAIDLQRKWGGRIREKNGREAEADLYRNWGFFLLDQNQPAEARKAFEAHYYLKPPEEGKRRLLDLCEYRERFAALRRTDFAFAFELGQWAAERDLLEEALRSFERAAEHESLKEAAGQQAAAVRKKIALARLEECMTLYENNDTREAIRKIDAFRDFPKDAETEDRFAKLYQLCAREMQRRSSLRTVQAEALLQDARRLLALREYGTVLRDLDRIVRQYPETPSAKEADNLARAVEMRVDIEKLEGPSRAPIEPRESPRAEPRAEREIWEILKALEIAGAEFEAERAEPD